VKQNTEIISKLFQNNFISHITTALQTPVAVYALPSVTVSETLS